MTSSSTKVEVDMENRRFFAFIAAALVATGAAACDREDRADVREVGRDVQEGAEDVGREVEEFVDDVDQDGKDD